MAQDNNSPYLEYDPNMQEFCGTCRGVVALRDQVAIAAMTGMLSARREVDADGTELDPWLANSYELHALAEGSYRVADAMLEARKPK
jgi:hypothetical protein